MILYYFQVQLNEGESIDLAARIIAAMIGKFYEQNVSGIFDSALLFY